MTNSHPMLTGNWLINILLDAKKEKQKTTMLVYAASFQANIFVQTA